MKKIFIIFFSISFSFIYAQEKKDNDQPEITYVEKLKIPEFTNPDIQKFAEEYTRFVEKYIAAVKEGKIYEVDTELQQTELQQIIDKFNEIAPKINENPEDAGKFSQYIESLTNELQKALSLSNVE